MRQSKMQSWHSRPAGTHKFVCDLPRLEIALKRLHLGKSSPGGLTAEMLRQLPHDELIKMAAAIQEMFRSLSFEASWTVITASFIPKKAVTRSLSDMRPISGLCHSRKLLKNLRMDALPPLQWMAPQAGFVRGHQPAEAAIVLTRVAELAKEWASPVYVGQLDLRQAFDKINHSAVIDVLRAKQVPSQLIAVLVASWSQSEVSVRFQSVSSHRQICMQRGVPQGAPESLLVFVMTSDCSLGRLQEQCARTDAGWSIDTPSGPLLIHCLAYADDVLVFARSESALVKMLCDCCVEFGNIGLEVALDKKTFWTSSVNSSGHSLSVNGVFLPWSPSIEFIGCIFDLTGHSAKSGEHRQLKANGVFRRWALLLTNQTLPIRERMKAFRVSVANSALWLAGCWTLTKTQSSKLGSWSARLLCRMVSCRRRPDETPAEHWCRRHRKGHELAESFGLNIPQQCLLMKHRLAGHLARSARDSLAHRTLVARDLGWWCHSQAAHAKLKDKWRGVHSQRFKVWRWETPLESFYGRIRRKPNKDVTSKGWMLRAQDRVAWKRDECAFIAQKT